MSKPPLKDRPELTKLLQEAVERFDALTPAQKLEMQMAQRRSWVIGNMMLSNPHMSRDYAERLYDKIGSP